MFTRQPDFIRKFAISVGKISFLKKILRPLYSKYTDALLEHRNELFRKNAIRVLDDFDKCLTSNGFEYTLAFGSMLGAIRECGCIKHDLDLDVAVWSEDYSSKIYDCLKDAGFSRVYELLVDDGDGGREETYKKDGVNIDVFYVYPAIDLYPYVCDFLVSEGAVSFPESMKKNGYIVARRLQLPWKKEFIRVPFGSLNLPVCSNAAEILSFRYGEDYMIPNPQWHCTDANKYTTVWSDKRACAKFK